MEALSAIQEQIKNKTKSRQEYRHADFLVFPHSR